MHAEAIEILRHLERTVDTNALLYRGVSYWPLCRLRLWAALMQRDVLAKTDGGTAVSNKGPTWPDVGQVAAELAAPQEMGLLRAAGSDVGMAKPTDVLFFLRPEEYADKVDDRPFAKILDSLYEHAATVTTAAKVELMEPRTLSWPRRYGSFFLSLDMAGRDVRFDPPGALENVETITSGVNALGQGITLDAPSLLTDMGKIFYFARIFEKTLRRLTPRALFLSVYYHPVGMAWMLACRWAGIRSIDVQHGRLGPHHGLYTQLTAAPSEGYHLLPDAVWCWGGQTKHDIDVDKAPSCSRHGGVVGGNPWLYKWRYGDTAGLIPSAAVAFEQQTADHHRILVSLQPLDEPVTPELLKAMQQSPPDWLWLLRLHPLRKHTAPEITAILRTAGVTNIEIENATSLPLFALLRMARHHVTVFSSVAMEAAAFGIGTSVLGPEGAAAFAPQIARGTYRYTPTAPVLLAHIREVIAQPPAVSDDFIQMREGVVGTALRDILASP